MFRTQELTDSNREKIKGRSFQIFKFQRNYTCNPGQIVSYSYVPTNQQKYFQSYCKREKVF
jgi:hypothetical protein